jgi:hypothetical protein
MDGLSGIRMVDEEALPSFLRAEVSDAQRDEEGAERKPFHVFCPLRENGEPYL